MEKARDGDCGRKVATRTGTGVETEIGHCGSVDGSEGRNGIGRHERLPSFKNCLGTRNGRMRTIKDWTRSTERQQKPPGIRRHPEQ
ncbi:Hypothetical predicted protein [Scomber scombrus]|uniref:Uncharacterized protein n=1 Tax=Scomber scombrus TaxID=13677 RepID=A0AAV1QE46_SCOSC